MKGPRWKATPEVRAILQKCKNIYQQWDKLGKPQDHRLRIELKEQKKLLRKKQRYEQAIARNRLYNQLMSNPDTQLFYRLIRKNSGNGKMHSNCLKVNGSYLFLPSEQREAFAQYYEDLSLPKEDEFDNSYVNLCTIRQKILEQSFKDQSIPLKPFEESEITKAINLLNSNKACDESGIYAEHLKYCQNEIAPYLTSLFNHILKTRKVPHLFKTGILFPVLKKEKDPAAVSSYRGITVTPIIGKVFEYGLLPKLLLRNNTDLQFGFTEGLNPLISSFVISESKTEQLTNHENFVIAIMDVQSAFDVVQHRIMLDKLIDRNVHPTLWMIIKDLYDGLTTKVKWMDGLSESFPILQGVRQGGILSTHLYKMFVEDLLIELENNCIGFSLGNIYVGTPTCADDIAFIESDNRNLQLMFNVLDRYAKQHHYKIHPIKTKIIECGKKGNDFEWSLGSNVIPKAEEAIHLGLIRSAKYEGNKNVDERIKLARRTQYALIGTGLHGTNGLDPVTSYKIYKTYVLPRLIYGLEVLSLNKADVSQLEKFHRKTLRCIQSLPQRTAVSAIYLLLGALPIEGELHRKQLSFLHNLLECNNQKVKAIVIRQISTNFDNKNSFFYKIRSVLSTYGLPNLHELIENVPTKLAWKKDINLKINRYWTQLLISDTESKSTLKLLNTSNMEIGRCHLVWDFKNKTKIEVRKAIIKARILCGTFTLQVDNFKFNRFNTSPTCLLCHSADETIEHFITRCPRLYSIREEPFRNIKETVIRNTTRGTWENLFNDDHSITKLIVDCGSFANLFLHRNVLLKIEHLTRDFCYQLYMKRLKLLSVTVKG